MPAKVEKSNGVAQIPTNKDKLSKVASKKKQQKHKEMKMAKKETHNDEAEDDYMSKLKAELDNSDMEEEKNDDLHNEGSDYEDDDEGDNIPISAMEFAQLEDENLQNQALGLLIKNNKKKVKEEQDKRRKINDFKFRVLDLLEIYTKKTKQPASFLKNVAQVIHVIRDEHRNQMKENLVRKLTVILRTYFQRDKELLSDFEYDTSILIGEILVAMKRMKSPKIQKILRFCLISILQIKSKIGDANENSANIALKYKESFEEYAKKKNPLIEPKVFKEFINKFPSLGVSLYSSLVKYLNLKDQGGARSDVQRNECLGMIDCLFNQKDKCTDQLVDSIVASQNDLKTVLNNVLENVGEIKKKKVNVLNKYIQVGQKARKVLKAYIESHPKEAEQKKIAKHDKQLGKILVEASEKLNESSNLSSTTIEKIKAKLA